MLEKAITDIKYSERTPEKIILYFKNGKKKTLFTEDSGAFSYCFKYKKFAILYTSFDLSKEVYSLCKQDLKFFPITRKLKKKLFYQEYYESYTKYRNKDNDKIYNELLKLPIKDYKLLAADKRFQSLNIPKVIKDEFSQIIDTASKHKINNVRFDIQISNLSINNERQLILRDIIVIE